MSRIGVGAIEHGSANEYYGQKITAASLDAESDRLYLSFADGRKIFIWDNGRECCEDRYMTCDDDLSKIVGGTLARIEMKKGEDQATEDYGVHEVTFVEIGTNECFVTIATHNEHNGYYGGFDLMISADERA